MRVLVAYATRHGATRGIAERLAETLGRAGLEVTVAAVDQAGDSSKYDAFVIGSAAYMGRWLAPASAFVRRNRSILATRPVWLFSSGPVGSATADAQGRSLLEVSRPREFDEFEEALQPQDERVFYGAFDPDAEPSGMMERLGAVFMRMPAIRKELPAGDFRDWPAIEAWAGQIARALWQSSPHGT